MDEAQVQLAADGAGKQVRNLKITVRSADVNGTETFSDRYVQVVAIADPVSGRVLDFDNDETVQLLQDIRTELRILNFQMYEQAGSKTFNPIDARGTEEFTR